MVTAAAAAVVVVVSTPASGARPDGVNETSTYSLFEGRLRFLLVGSVAAAGEEDEDVVVGIFSAPSTVMAMAGTVPVPVAAMMEGSACSSSHRMVSPSDLWPSSRVSWKTRAAQVAGIRILRPRPSTFVWRSFVDTLFATAVCTGTGTGMDIARGNMLIPVGCGGEESSTLGSSFIDNTGTAAASGGFWGSSAINAGWTLVEVCLN